jgi:hypothetical protein
MTSTPPSADAQGCLENLMRAGQDAMKQFGDALVSAAGVGTKDSLSSGRLLFPFAMIADLQREYFKRLYQFWNSIFLQTFAGGAHSVCDPLVQAFSRLSRVWSTGSSKLEVEYSAKVFSLALNKFLLLVAVAIGRIFAVLKIGIQ